jgi:ribonuclease-3
MERNLEKLEDILNVSFNNKDILKNALVHRSYLNEHKSFALEHNERLEFLGDAVLELVVTDYLYHNYKDPEGILTNWRSSLVNATSLAVISERLKIYDYLYLSRGESKDNNKKARNYILSNALEAIIGAIYLDQGYQATEKFIGDNLIINLKKIIADKSYIDPKSLFQEKSQEILNITPHYKVLSESGPDHNKKFIVGVYINKELITKGKGYSKQEAQTEAAEEALKIKNWS